MKTGDRFKPSGNQGKVISHRRYHVEKEPDQTGEWQHRLIVLRPENDQYPPTTLEIRKGEDVKVLGEFVSVLPRQA